MRNISDQICGENQNIFYVQYCPPPTPHPENRAVCEIMWKDIVERRQDTDDNILWCI